MDGTDELEIVFADTCVLLNFVQREWEHDRSSALVESDAVRLVVSQSVLDELADVSARRRDIYEDMVDFLLESDGAIEEYDPSDRRVYFEPNDRTHVRRVQEQLAQIDGRNVVLRRLRRFVRAAGRRVEHLQSSFEDGAVDPMPPLELRFALDRLLDHDADTRVVTDAAAWTADGGSGVLVTLDSDDIFENEAEIVALLEAEQGPDWVVDIVPPDRVVQQTRAPGEAE